MKKKDLLKNVVEHIDIKAINAVEMIQAMKKMSFSARDLAYAADIYDRMLKEKKCAVILTLAGSTSAAGCMQVYVDHGEEQYGGRDCGDRRGHCRYGFF